MEFNRAWIVGLMLVAGGVGSLAAFGLLALAGVIIVRSNAPLSFAPWWWWLVPISAIIGGTITMGIATILERRE